MEHIIEIHAGADIPGHNINQKYTYFDKSMGDNPKKQYQDMSMDAYQKRVYQQILNNRNIFVAASPAAGKTRPTTKALLQKYIIAAENRDRPPKVLVSVPLAQLALQTQEEYVNIFIDLFTKRTPGYNEDQESIKMSRIINMFPGKIRDELALLVGETYTSFQYHKLFNFIKNNMIGIATAGASGRPTQDTMIDIAVVELAAKQVQNKYYDIIIVDEVQELFKEYATEYDKDLIKDAGFYHTIFDKGQNSQFIFLTGTTASKTADNFIEHLEKFYKMKKFDLLSSKTLPDSKPSTNRSELRVVPYTEMGTGDIFQVPMIAKAIKKRLDNNIKYNALIIFSKKVIYEICKRLIDIVEPKSIIGQTSTIISADKSKESSPWSFRQPFGRSTGQITSSGVPFIKGALTGSAMGTLPKSQASKYGEFKHQQKIKVGARQFVSNELLAHCLVRGFGFMAGGQEENLKNDIERAMFLPFEDKKVVQDLFKNGKIKFVLATDAVGIGVNMIVQHLFLPSLDKFTAGKTGPISTGPLLQLLHRAGRGAVGTAFVYTSPENVERVTYLFSKDPTETVDVVSIDRLKNATPINKLIVLLKQMNQGQ